MTFLITFVVVYMLLNYIMDNQECQYEEDKILYCVFYCNNFNKCIFYWCIIYYFYDTLLDYFTKISLFARTHKEDKEDENKL